MPFNSVFISGSLVVILEAACLFLAASLAVRIFNCAVALSNFLLRTSMRFLCETTCLTGATFLRTPLVFAEVTFLRAPLVLTGALS